MKTVLAPIDFSPVSKRVIDEAILVARAIEARLVLFNVVPSPPKIAPEFPATDDSADFALQGEKESAERLMRLQRQLRTDGVTAHAIHEVGVPGQRIVEQAERLDADYVVMGSHGHGAFYDLLVGSTTSRVLKQCPCAVVVVPVGHKKSRPDKIPAAASADKAKNGKTP